MEKLFSRAVRGLVILAIAAAAGTFSVSRAQEVKTLPTPKTSPTPKPSPTGKPVIKINIKPTTAEELAETTIFFYAYPGGRATLGQIRKTTQEHGRTTVTNTEGKTEKINYQRYVIRADALDKEKIRLDQELPTAKFSLVYSDSNIFGIYNNSTFPLREDVRKGFENQIFHGMEALLRYQESGSTLQLQPNVKMLGVEYYVLEVTDKQGRKTTFFISAKTFRIMMLTYEDEGVQYRRRYYDYNYAQGTLLPSRSVLWADDKIVEESEILYVIYGQKVDEEMFRTG